MDENMASGKCILRTPYESRCDCEECGPKDVCKDCEFWNCMCVCYSHDGKKFKEFLTKNGFDEEYWRWKLMSIPHPKYSDKDGFIFNLEFIGDDHELTDVKKKDVIAWMKLTQKLLG